MGQLAPPETLYDLMVAYASKSHERRDNRKELAADDIAQRYNVVAYPLRYCVSSIGSPCGCWAPPAVYGILNPF